MQTTIRRSLATAAVLALTLGTAACGEEDFGSEDVDTTYDNVDVSQEVAVDSIVGLEVSAVGNVSDILSSEAVRLDRDGLGDVEDQGEVGREYVYDYDYYDSDFLTEYDDDFGDADVVDEGVLVVGPEDVLSQRDVDEAVRVSGTVRRYDQDTLESVYELDLTGDEFDDVGDMLVIVADSVSPADETPDATERDVTDGVAEDVTEDATEDATDGATDEASEDSEG